MTVKLMRWFEGSRDYRILPEQSEHAVRMLSRAGLKYRKLRMSDDGLSFTLPGGDCKKAEQILKERSIDFEIVGERGIVHLVKKYRKRIGIPVGALLFCAVLFLSEQFVWTLEVDGNNTVPADEILAGLDGLGCGVGSYIPGIDVARLCDEYLLSDPRLSWISVNIRGTSVNVAVREAEIPETFVPENTPYNLVASEDGFVEYVEILRGTPMVEEGALVRKGELLASGIEELKNGLHLVHASGTVTAAVRRSIRVEIPLEDRIKEPTGREYSCKTLNIFGISVEFFDNTENISSEYDKIEYDKAEKERYLCFFNAVEVPISVHETVWREYAAVPVSRTENEARTEAYRQLREKCDAVLADCELVSREVREGLADGVFVIECELTVIKNIAEELPIYTSDGSQ